MDRGGETDAPQLSSSDRAYSTVSSGEVGATYACICRGDDRRATRRAGARTERRPCWGTVETDEPGHVWLHDGEVGIRVVKSMEDPSVRL